MGNLTGGKEEKSETACEQAVRSGLDEAEEEGSPRRRHRPSLIFLSRGATHNGIARASPGHRQGIATIALYLGPEVPPILEAGL